jgi:branched-chain amino acid transport system substrate-binding protein
MPNFIHAGTYSAVTTYLKAVQTANTDAPAKVMQQLKATPVNDMFARNGRIREDGRMVHDLYLVQVKKPTEIKDTWDYYLVKETVPGEEAFQPLTTSKCRLVKK